MNDRIDGVKLPFDPDRQTLPGELIDDIQCPERSAVMGSLMDKVIRPDVIGEFWPQPNTRAVVGPRTAFLWLFGRTFSSSRCHRRSIRLSFTCRPD